MYESECKALKVKYSMQRGYAPGNLAFQQQRHYSLVNLMALFALPVLTVLNCQRPQASSGSQPSAAHETLALTP
jgi:hypothetical protein